MGCKSERLRNIGNVPRSSSTTRSRSDVISRPFAPERYLYTRISLLLFSSRSNSVLALLSAVPDVDMDLNVMLSSCIRASSQKLGEAETFESEMGLQAEVG